MTHTFKKHFIDAEDNFKIGYYVDSAFQKFVNSDKPAFLEYIKDNILNTVAFVPPPALTINQKRQRVIQKINTKRTNLFNEGIAYKDHIFNSDPTGREMFLCGKRNKDTVATVKAVAQDGQIVELTSDEIGELSDNFDAKCLQIYDNSVQDYIKALSTTEAELDYYLANNEYEG